MYVKAVNTMFVDNPDMTHRAENREPAVSMKFLMLMTLMFRWFVNQVSFFSGIFLDNILEKLENGVPFNMILYKGVLSH